MGCKYFIYYITPVKYITAIRDDHSMNIIAQ